MTEEEYRKHIRRAEAELHRHPRRYRRTLARLLFLGDLTAWLLPILLLGTLLGLGFLAWNHHAFWLFLLGSKLIFALLILVWLLFRALLIGVTLPEGYILDSTEAPKLQELIRNYQHRFDTPPIYRVLLDTEFNAAVVTLPRSLLPGGERIVLILGIPLMAALSPEEFRAVLAHEFGHIRQDQGRFASRLYRTRQRWELLDQSYAKHSDWSLWPIRRFLDFYIPRLGSYAFALLREHEYEADRCAAETTAPETVASALIRTALCSEALERYYWPRFYARNADEARVPDDAFRGLERFFAHQASISDASSRQITALLRHAGHYREIHPSTSERLQAIQAAPRLQKRHRSALAHWLAPDTENILERCDQSFRETLQPWWETRYRELQRDKKLLEDYRKRPETDLSPEELYHCAQLYDALGSGAEACRLFSQLLPHDDPEIHYQYALCLPPDEEEKILKHLFRALESPYRFEEAREWGDGLIASDDTATLLSWQKAIEREAQRHAAWTRALDRETDTRPSVVHAPDIIERFRRFMEGADGVEAAWIACREIPSHPRYPLYLIAVKFTGGFFQDQEALIAELYQTGPAEPVWTILSLQGRFWKTAEAIRDIGVPLRLPCDP